jgi:hypothetical protein
MFGLESKRQLKTALAIIEKVLPAYESALRTEIEATNLVVKLMAMNETQATEIAALTGQRDGLLQVARSSAQRETALDSAFLAACGVSEV